MRFLFCCLDSPGFTYPLIGLAHKLVEQGHQAAFATGQQMAAVLHRTSIERIPRSHSDGPSFQVEHWHRDVGIALQVMHIDYAVREFAPHVLVGSHLTTGHLIEAERYDLPVATLGLAAYLWPWSEVPSSQEEDREGPDALRAFRYGGHMEAYRQACEQLGRPVRDSGIRHTPLLGDLYLLRSVPGLAPEIEALPEQVHLVGDCLWEPEAEDPTLDAWLLEAVSSSAPVIYVQQGRAFGWHSFWQLLMKIASDCQAWFVASTGRMDQEAGRLPKNVLAMPHAPQQRILPHAGAVICSGNTTAVLGALTHGIPSLLLPMGGEQPELADRCQEAGVSLAIAPETLSPSILRTALEHLMGDNSLSQQARLMRDEFHCWQGTRRAVALLEELAHSKKPVLRCRGAA